MLKVVSIMVGFLILGITVYTDNITSPVFEILIGIGALIFGYGFLGILRIKK